MLEKTKLYSLPINSPYNVTDLNYKMFVKEMEAVASYEDEQFDLPFQNYYDELVKFINRLRAVQLAMPYERNVAIDTMIEYAETLESDIPFEKTSEGLKEIYDNEIKEIDESVQKTQEFLCKSAAVRSLEQGICTMYGPIRAKFLPSLSSMMAKDAATGSILKETSDVLKEFNYKKFINNHNGIARCFRELKDEDNGLYKREVLAQLKLCLNSYEKMKVSKQDIKCKVILPFCHLAMSMDKDELADAIGIEYKPEKGINR